jgi:hypothetical protein
MIAMDLQKEEFNFSSKSPEAMFSISLAECVKSTEIDYSKNPHILLEIEEFRGVIGLASPVQAGMLVNQNLSCWLTNLGRNGSTEVYRPANKTFRRLAYNQVAYLRHGDFVGFYGAFYRLEFRKNKLVLIPVQTRKTSKLAS